MKKISIITLGCKVNSYETEAMQALILEAGAKIVEFSEIADIYVVNTCSVTNMADRKSRQMLHRAKKKNPNALVIATGCYAQTAEENAMKETGIDVIWHIRLKKNPPPGVQGSMLMPFGLENGEFSTIVNTNPLLINWSDGSNGSLAFNPEYKWHRGYYGNRKKVIFTPFYSERAKNFFALPIIFLIIFLLC